MNPYSGYIPATDNTIRQYIAVQYTTVYKVEEGRSLNGLRDSSAKVEIQSNPRYAKNRIKATSRLP